MHLRLGSTRMAPVPSTVLSVLLVLCLAIQLGAEAQSVTTVSSTVSCPDCRIVLDSVVVLDGRRAEHVGEPVALAHMSDGRVLLSPQFDMSLVAVFDQRGRFLGRLGRKGEGPGEFMGVGQIRVGRGDTVRIYDHWNPRVTVFSPELELVGTRKMTLPVGGGTNGLVELPDGRLVTQRPFAIPEYAGFPVHLMSADGKILLSFGSEEENPGYRLGQERLMWHTIASASDDRVWVAPTTRYSIGLWDLSGRMLAKLDRAPSWFPPHPDSPFGIDYDNPNSPPHPGIIGLWQDSEGRLWTLTYVADEHYQEALGPVQGIGGELRAVTNEQRYSDTMVEVLDPQSGELIASRRIDASLNMFAAISKTGRVAAYREDERGFPYVDVWDLRLEVP